LERWEDEVWINTHIDLEEDGQQRHHHDHKRNPKKDNKENPHTLLIQKKSIKTTDHTLPIIIKPKWIRTTDSGLVAGGKTSCHRHRLKNSIPSKFFLFRWIGAIDFISILEGRAIKSEGFLANV